MGKCKVDYNCLNFINECNICWYCVDDRNYLPVDKRILSNYQLAKSEKFKIARKARKQKQEYKKGKKAFMKGIKSEDELIKFFKKHNIKAKKQIGSGRYKGSLGGDIVIELENGEKRKVEVKTRKTGGNNFYTYLNQDNCDYVFFKADGKEWLVIQTLQTWINE